MKLISRIANGRMLGDLKGKLTRHKWNGSSTMDTGIVQNSLFREVDFFKVYDLMALTYRIIVLFHWDCSVILKPQPIVIRSNIN